MKLFSTTDFDIKIRPEIGPDDAIRYKSGPSATSFLVPLVVAVILVFQLPTLFDLFDRLSTLGKLLLVPMVLLPVLVLIGPIRSLATPARRVEIADGRVSVQSSSLTGKTRWEEPVSAYEGVRWRVRSRSTDRGRTTQYQHLIDLQHRDPEKSVALMLTDWAMDNQTENGLLGTFAIIKAAAADPNSAEAQQELTDMFADAAKSRSAEIRKTWEAFAAKFDLPAIDARHGAPVVRETDELDKTLAERVAPVRDALPWDSSPPDGSGILVHRDERTENIVIDIPFTRGERYGVYVVILGLVAVSIAILFSEAPEAVAITGGMAALLIWQKWKQAVGPHLLTISRTRLTHVDPHNSKSNFDFALDEIEQIELLPSGKSIVVASDAREVVFATNMSAEARKWLHEYLVAAIAHA